jgi:hypothetical protein
LVYYRSDWKRELSEEGRTMGTSSECGSVRLVSAGALLVAVFQVRITYLANADTMCVPNISALALAWSE